MYNITIFSLVYQMGLKDFFTRVEGKLQISDVFYFNPDNGIVALSQKPYQYSKEPPIEGHQIVTTVIKWTRLIFVLHNVLFSLIGIYMIMFTA